MCYPDLSRSSGPWWRRQCQPTPVLLPGKSHGRRSLVGCSPWGRKESDTTEQLHFSFSLSCIGEGNGNPLQYSCLENSMNRGGWRLQSMGSDVTELLKLSLCFKLAPLGFSGGSVVKNPPANVGDVGSIPGTGRSSGGGNGNPLQ